MKFGNCLKICKLYAPKLHKNSEICLFIAIIVQNTTKIA